MDIVVSALLLVLLAPVFLVIGVVVRVTVGTPILFRQSRPGLHGQTFTINKFRTMRDAREKTGAYLPDADRLTRVGTILRRSSLDELPELWNVLVGDMSLVGPRPLLVDYIPLYSSDQARRHELRPGITGWAQINGRNALDWEDRFLLDAWYVDNVGFALDVRILILTIVKVIRRDGITAQGEATMPKFTGERK